MADEVVCRVVRSAFHLQRRSRISEDDRYQGAPCRAGTDERRRSDRLVHPQSQITTTGGGSHGASVPHRNTNSTQPGAQKVIGRTLGTGREGLPASQARLAEKGGTASRRDDGTGVTATATVALLDKSRRRAGTEQ